VDELTQKQIEALQAADEAIIALVNKIAAMTQAVFASTAEAMQPWLQEMARALGPVLESSAQPHFTNGEKRIKRIIARHLKAMRLLRR
jgi:hypothetical protein